MKLLKLASLTLIASVSFGVYNANAGIGITTNSSTLNVSLTVTTNAATTVNGNTYTYKNKTAKVTNKNLIDLFSHWSTNAFATSGAKLVIGWDSPWYGDVLVVDKTGTNVLFDASSGNGSAYFYVDYFDEYGAFSGKYVDASPGSYTYKYANGGYFELYDDDYYLPYTDLWGYGSAKVNFSENWDADGNYKNWSASTLFRSVDEGDQYFLDVGSDSTTSGNINANGSGKGYNGYFD